MLVLNELRHQPNTALKLRIPLSRTDLSETKAVLGEMGLVQGKDYRGVNVVPVLLSIKDSPWFIVAKEDRAEILEELGVRTRLILTGMLSLLLLPVAGVFIVLQRNRKEYYKALYKAEAKLRESEARFRLAAENATDLIYDWDIESGKLDWFGKLDELLGYATGEFPRTIKAWEESIHPDERERVMATLDRHLKTGTEYVEEYRIRRKDGTYAYWVDKGTAIRNSEGVPVRMIGVCTDITKRKQAEENLKKNEARLRLLNRVAQVTIESRSSDEIADRLLEIIREIMPCDAFYIDAYDETTNEVRGIKTYDTIDGVLCSVPTQVIKPDKSGEFYQTIILKNQTLRILRKPEDLSSTTMTPFGDVTRLSASLLFAPLIARNKVLGVISVQSYTPYAYTEEDERLIGDIARQAGPAFEAIQLYQQTLQVKEDLSLANKRLEFIAQMTGAVVGARSKKELAQSLTSQVCESFGVDACIIRELVGNKLVLVGATGVPPESQIQEMEIHGLGKEILTTRKPLVIPDVYTHPLTRELAEHKPSIFQFFSYAGVPMIVQDEIVGILGVYTTTERREFTPTDITHLQIVANDAGIALINERLFADLQQQRDKLEQEITERQRAEEALRISEISYRTLFESALDAIMILEVPSCRFSVVNPATVAIFGAQTEEDLVDKTPWELSPDFQPDGRESEEKAREMINIALQKGSHFFEWVHKKMDGKEFPATVQLIRVELEGRVYLQATVCDVTETKRLQAQFLQAQKMEAVGRLAGGVAHDFNNLLTGILGYADLALMYLSPSDPIYEEIINIKDTALRASNLVRQLLAFSRRQPAEPRVINLNQHIVELENLLRRLIGEDIKLITLLAEDLAPVKIDPAQVEQIIMNLAVNARDAMPNGGLLTIETQNVHLDQEYVRTHPEVISGEYVMLAISDTGCGMSEEVKAHLFEPFFTTKDRTKGTGLGLPTVYGIVKQNNGFIYVSSEVG
ncbi:MAG: PAS domain S-box protein, partial [Candidatus Sumerlaeia bacterium]|nr:PAS domain S-box protein [Candidatus Sumerlaeia bacterium]